MGSHRRRRIIGLCLALALLLAPSAPGALASSGPDVWPAILASASLALPVASGIEYRHVTLATSDGPLDIHQLRVDLGNPTIQMGAGLAHDQLMSQDETVSSMVLRSSAIAGVNADYFDIHQSGIPLNIVVQNGQLLRSPWRWVAFVLGKDGAARIIRYRWTGSITVPATGETRPLDGYNSGLSQSGIIAISDIRGYGAPLPESSIRQTVVELTPADEPNGYFVKEVWPQQGFYVPFPKDDIILVGRGAGADWLGRLTAGTPVLVDLTTDPDWHDAQLAIGGGPVLVENGRIVQDPDAPAPKERDHRNPVIAVGIAPDGRSLTFVEVDGRQPSLSIGLTRPQLAEYMQRLGAAQAMAFDSGGSATMVVRLPGQPAPEVVNSPSDGTERPVADALLVYSTAVPGPPARLLVNAGRPLELLAGARVTLPVIGVDAQGNPTALRDPPQVTAAPPELVTVGADGTLTAETAAGTGTVTAQSGAAGGTIPVSVVTRLARLVVSPASVTVAPGAGATFVLSGQDGAGRAVGLPDGGATWTVDPPWLGAISGSGLFVAGSAPGGGTVTVRLAGAVGRAHVAIGSTARYVSRFDLGEWTFRGYPDTVTGAVTLVSDPSREGRPSARLAFSLDGTGTRAAYLMTQLPLEGAPTGITLWVYGDGSGVWLRGTYDQANGERGTVTLARHVDWRGWRSVTAALPQGIAYPITWTSLYVVEADPARVPHGVLYLSSVRAIYPAGTAP